MCEDFASAVGDCVKVIFPKKASSCFSNLCAIMLSFIASPFLFFGVTLRILAKIMQEGDFSFYEASLFANLTTYG